MIIKHEDALEMADFKLLFRIFIPLEHVREINFG